MTLCRTTLMRQLASALPIWVDDIDRQRLHLEGHLHELFIDRELQATVRALCDERSLPVWQTQLPGSVSVTPATGPYRIVGVDGSHIAPDYHAGLVWGLTNIGSCLLEYGASLSMMEYNTHPQLYQVPGDEALLGQYRARDELLYVTDYWTSREEGRRPALLMVDGPLISEHGEGDAWFESLFAQWQEHQIPIMGYVSMPHSRLLTGVLMELCKSKCAEYEQLGRVHLSDGLLFASFLPSGHRSNVWRLPPYVEAVFINVGLECVRLEFPVYLRHDNAQWELLVRIVMDQVRKGFGYPRCLAEAHWQALIRESDRQFVIEQFLAASQRRGHRIQRHAWSWRQGYGTSAKLARKRHIPM